MSMKIKIILARIERFLKYISAILMAVITYPLGRLFYRNKGIWLIGERNNQAQDNGYHMFKYICENHPEHNVYYVIKKDSDHVKKVASIGKVLYYGTWKHWMMYYGCEVVISTHIRKVLPSDVWSFRNLASHFKQKNKLVVFLQHGIINGNLVNLYQEKTRVDLFICGAKPEYDIVKRDYHYHNDEVVYTGLARYDALHDFTVKKQILLMPTWRLWLAVMGYDVKNSEYVREWNKVLTDKRLIAAAKKAGYQIIFFPHHELQFACDMFQSVDDCVIIGRETEYDVQTLLKESALMMTDHSSVFFDFAYMHKPVLYFQFDNDVFYKDHYGEGYYDFEKDGFGKVSYTAEDAVNDIIEEIENDMVLTQKYRERIDRFFPLHDRNNRKRIYDEIMIRYNRMKKHK